MYNKTKKEAIIQEEFKAYSVVWECNKGHKNFQTIIGKEGTQHDICLKCGEHYEYVVANGVEQSSSNCNIPHISGTLPIGAKVVIIDDENAFGNNANREMTVTGYGEWRGNPQGGYILNGMTDSLWLAEDFESVFAMGN